jgi:hypothetical protein
MTNRLTQMKEQGPWLTQFLNNARQVPQDYQKHKRDRQIRNPGLFLKFCNGQPFRSKQSTRRVGHQRMDAPKMFPGF